MRVLLLLAINIDFKSKPVQYFFFSFVFRFCVICWWGIVARTGATIARQKLSYKLLAKVYKKLEVFAALITLTFPVLLFIFRVFVCDLWLFYCHSRTQIFEKLPNIKFHFISYFKSFWMNCFIIVLLGTWLYNKKRYEQFYSWDDRKKASVLAWWSYMLSWLYIYYMLGHITTGLLKRV